MHPIFFVKEDLKWTEEFLAILTRTVYLFGIKIKQTERFAEYDSIVKRNIFFGEPNSLKP